MARDLAHSSSAGARSLRAEAGEVCGPNRAARCPQQTFLCPSGGSGFPLPLPAGNAPPPHNAACLLCFPLQPQVPTARSLRSVTASLLSCTRAGFALTSCSVAMVFPVVMYGCESWTVKKAECQRIGAFELWCWRRLLRVPWTERRSNRSILREISPGCSLEALMLKLKLQYFGHVMRRADSLEKTLMLGGIGGRRRRGQQRMRWLHGIIDPMDMNLCRLWAIVKDREAWYAAAHGVAKSQTRLSN